VGSKVKVIGIGGLNTAPEGPSSQGIDTIFSPCGAVGALVKGAAESMFMAAPLRVPLVPEGTDILT
jgi:hypothetical protein